MLFAFAAKRIRDALLLSLSFIVSPLHLSMVGDMGGLVWLGKNVKGWSCLHCL
jgi:hypothetical protein